MKLKTIQIRICEECLDGKGDECHTPGCALFLHSVDLPIHPETYVVIHVETEEEALAAAERQLVEAMMQAGANKAKA